MNIIKFEKNNYLKYGLLSALFVFIIGFGIMFLIYSFWNIGASSYEKSLKGLFDYKASTYGDSIILPLMIGSGIAYVTYFYKEIEDRNKKKLPLIMGVIGGFIALLIQLKWIISDTTPLNWSIPRQHHFNFGGWYHAVFFIFIFFMVFFLFTYIIQIDKYVIQYKIEKGKFEYHELTIYTFCQILYWFSNIFFLHLNFLDDYSSVYNENEIVFFSSIFFIIIIFFIKNIIIIKNIMHKKISTLDYIKFIFPIFIATINAFIISNFFLQFNKFFSDNNYSNPINVFVLSFPLCSLMYLYNSGNKRKMLLMGIYYIFFHYISFIQISYYLNDQDWCSFVYWGCIFIFSQLIISSFDYLVLEKKNYNINLYIRIIVLIVFIYISFIFLEHRNIWEKVFHNDLILSRLELPSDIFNRIAYLLSIILITKIFHLYVITSFKRIRNKEYQQSLDDNYELQQLRSTQYGIYFFIFLPAIFFLIISISEFKIFYIEKTKFLYNLTINIISIIVLTLEYFFINKFFYSLKYSSFKLILSINYILYSVYLLYLIFIEKNSFINMINQNIGGNTVIFLILINIVINHYRVMKASFIYNVIKLRLNKPKKDTSILASWIALCGSICIFFAMISFYINFSINGLLNLIICIILNLLTLRIFAKLLNDKKDEGLLSTIKPMQAVTQDTFLFGITIITNIVLITKISRCIIYSEYLTIFLMIISYSVLVKTLVQYCIDNNINHLEKKREEKESIIMKKSDKEIEKIELQFRLLEEYLLLQNNLSIILSIPFSVSHIVEKWYSDYANDSFNKK